MKMNKKTNNTKMTRMNTDTTNELNHQYTKNNETMNMKKHTTYKKTKKKKMTQ